MKLLLPKRTSIRILIVVIAFVLIVMAGDIALVRARRHIPISYDTTRATEPTTADGMIDYVAAVDSEYARGVTDNNNAAGLLIQAFGPTALPKKFKADVAQRLHITVPPASGDYLIPFEYFESLATHRFSRPEIDFDTWPIGDVAKVERWVKRNEKPLQLIKRAAERSRLYIPTNVGPANQLLVERDMPHLNSMRQAALLLAADAQLRAAAGEVGPAYADVLTIHSLARQLSQTPFEIDMLVAAGIDALAFQTDRHIAQHVSIKGAEAEVLKIESAPATELSFAHAIDISNRYFVLQTALMVAAEGGLTPLRTLLPIPHAEVMRTENAEFDAIVNAMNQPTYRERKSALKAAATSLEAPPPMYMGYSGGYLVMLTVVPDLALAHLNATMTRAVTDRRLTQIVRALGMYHQDQGQYPTELKLLAPRYLHEVPNDAFTEVAFCYERTADGYRLYSVGPNLHDDGGRNGSISEDDINVGLGSATTKPADVGDQN